MQELRVDVRIDDAGNIIGRREGNGKELPVLILGSHLDTVPDGGRYDGLLGFLMSLGAVGGMGSASLPFDIDVICFSEEEGVRFLQPYLGSRAIAGSFEHEWLSRVDSIVGQSRLVLRFDGHASHAGTTPMSLRRDALVTASRWVAEVSRYARLVTDLQATVGFIDVKPNARNVIPGRVETSLDVRHSIDSVRVTAVAEFCRLAQEYADEADVAFSIIEHQTQPAVVMNPRLPARFCFVDIGSLGVSVVRRRHDLSQRFNRFHSGSQREDKKGTNSARRNANACSSRPCVDRDRLLRRIDTHALAVHIRRGTD